MPKECAVCKQPAVVAARITQGEQTANVFLCENCIRRVGKQAKVEVLGSVSALFPKGTVITPPIKNPDSSLHNTAQPRTSPQLSPASKQGTPPSAVSTKLSDKINSGIQSVKSVYNSEKTQQAKKRIQSAFSSISSSVQQRFVQDATEKNEQTSLRTPDNNGIRKKLNKKAITIIVASLLLLLVIATIPNWGKKSQDKIVIDTPEDTIDNEVDNRIDLINVVDMTLNEAVSTLKARGFANIQSNVDDSEKDYTWIVTSQSPSRWDRIMPDELVYLTCKRQRSISLTLKSDYNLIFSKYDMDIYFDDTKIGTVSNGDILSTDIKATEGDHTIKVKRSDATDPSTVQLVTVSKDTVFHCTIAHGADSITLNNVKIRSKENR